LLHQLKEFVIQTFFRGNVLACLHGSVTEVKSKKGNVSSIFKVAAKDVESAKKVDGKNNICYIMSSNIKVLACLLPMELHRMIFRNYILLVLFIFCGRNERGAKISVPSEDILGGGFRAGGEDIWAR